MISDIVELAQNEAVAYFRADLCLGDPDSYSLGEKRCLRQANIARPSLRIGPIGKSEFASGLTTIRIER